MKKIFLIYLIFTFFAPCTLQGQDANYTLISMEDGLPSNTVYTALRDKKGYLWFSTDRGVAKYDGKNMKVFTTKDGLKTNDIWELWEDSLGRIWVYCFTKETQYIENDTVKLAFTKTNKTTIKPLMEADGIVYTADFTNLYKFKNNQAQVVPLDFRSKIFQPIVLPNFKIVNQLPDYTYDEELDINTLKTKTLKENKNSPKTTAVLNSYFQIDNSIYQIELKSDLIIELNAYDLSKDKIKTINISKIWKTPLRSIKLTPHPKGLQLISKEGFLIFDKNLNLVEHFKQKQFKLNTAYESVFTHDNGDIFIIKKNIGIYLLANENKNINHFDFAGNKITSMDKSPSNEIYIGFENGAFGKQYKDNHLPLVEGGLAKTEVIKINFSDNKLWIYRNDKLKIYNKRYKDISKNNNSKFILNSFCNRNILNKHSTSTHLSLESTNKINLNGNLKNVSFNKKLNWMIISPGSMYLQIRKHQKDNSIDINCYPTVRQYATGISNDSIVWTGSSEGLKYIYRDSIFDLSKKDPLLGRTINNILVDVAQNVWVGTDGFGLYSVDKDKNAHLVNGLEDDIILDIKDGDDEDIWVSTNEGVKQIFFEKNKAQIGQIYSTANGLSSNINSTIFVSDSLLYAGSSLGLDMVNYKKKISTLPQLYIESLEINGQDFGFSDTLNLNSDQNNIKINYSGISFKTKKGLNYSYYMSNFNQDTVLTENDFIQFENLKPGTYHFNIWANDKEGLSSTKRQIFINIGKPWHQTNLFYLFLILLTAGIIYLITQYFIKREQKKENIEKKMAQLELQSLQSQMNPHFLFNAINAIQEYLYDNKKEDVEAYFTDFAKLMRFYLESSRTKSISLQSEIEMLKLYTKLEKLRFADKFTVSFHIDDSIENEDINIPTMLVQPFVENAINHGLFHKKSQGHVSLSFDTNKETLVVIVEDNGIGREKAKEIKRKSIHNYKSRALEITDERINILKESLDLEISITTTDLYKDNIATGTKVRIVIPLDF